MARDALWRRHGTTHSMEMWHETLHGADMARDTTWSRHGTTHSMEQIWHETLHGAEMALDTPRSRNGTRHSMEQKWHETLHGADMARHTPWSTYGMASKLPGTDFIDKLPVVHSVAIFLACYGTHSVTNKPHAKPCNNKNYVIDTALYVTCPSLVTLHVIASAVSVNYKRFLPPQPTQGLLE